MYTYKSNRFTGQPGILT